MVRNLIVIALVGLSAYLLLNGDDPARHMFIALLPLSAAVAIGLLTPD